MRIGIDFRGAARDGADYFHGLIRGLLAIDCVNEYHIFADGSEAIASAVQGRTNAKLVNPLSISLYAAWRRLDVLHCSRAIPAFVRAATVLTVPEISFELCPQDFPAAELKRLKRTVRGNCAKADLVFAVSAHCMRQLHETYRIPANKIVIAPQAADHLSQRAGFSRTPESLGLPPRYVVYTGGPRLNHNLPRMLAAFDQLVSRAGIPHYLVIPAPRGDTAQGFEYALRLMRNRTRVLVFRNLSETDVHVALRGADVFACPSLYDGPGMSPMVAQRLDVPCLLSDAGCFPEVYGDSAVYCNPLDAGSIASALESLLADPLLRSDLVLRGAERTRRCSWKRTAAVALDAYHRVAPARAAAREAPAALEA